MRARAPRLRTRPARESDVATILGFLRGLAAYENLTRECMIDARRVRAHFFGRRPLVSALIAELAGAPVGLAVYCPTYSTFAARPGLWVEDVFVLPEARGRGVGRALFAALARIAVTRGCDRMGWSVLSWNRPALAFYRRLGAEPVRGWVGRRLGGAALTRLAGQVRSRRADR